MCDKLIMLEYIKFFMYDGNVGTIVKCDCH